MNEYKLTLTEEQLVVLNTSLEWFFRLQLGQFFDFVDEIAKGSFEYDKKNPDNDRLFDEYIDRRNLCKDLMDHAYRIAKPEQTEQTKDMMIAQDIWSVIRHFRWKERPEPKSHNTVDANSPLLISGQPEVRIERVKE